MFTKFIDNVLTDEECNLIINYGLTQNLDYIQTYSPDSKENFIDFKFNKRKGFMFDNPEFDVYANRLLEVVNESKIYSNIKYNEIGTYLFNAYSETNFLNYHIDNHKL